MTQQINDGGPAFPQNDLSGYGMGPVETVDGFYKMQGMSLRDCFAIKALAGMLTSPHFADFVRGAGNYSTEDEFRLRAAEASYGYADAMLAVRARP